MDWKYRNAPFARSLAVALAIPLSFGGAWAADGAAVTTQRAVANQQVSTIETPSVSAVATAWDDVFEIEGDAIDSPPAGPEDWSILNTNHANLPPPNNVLPAVGVSGFATGPAGSASVWTFVSDPPVRTDLIYTGGGSKDFNDIPSWGQVARGTGPDKDDVEHAFAARYVDNVAGSLFNGHDILVFGGDRPTSNGDANIGFWFFQNPVGPNNSGGFSSTHRNGDIFVLSAFTNGGGTSGIRVLVWVGAPDTAGPGGTDSGAVARCNAFGAGSTIDPKSDTTAFPQGTLCDITTTAPNAGIAFTNLGDVHVSWQYQNKDNKTTCTNPTTGADSPCVIPTPDFFEGAIDLTALHLASECLSSFLLETRSSAEVSAVLKDFALGAFNTCSCNVNSPSVCSGTDAQFCAVNPDGTSGPYHYSWTGPGGAIATDAQCITVHGATAADVGNYSVTITASGGIRVTCQGALTVGTGPTAAVSGGGEYCAVPGGSGSIRLDLTGTGPWTVTWSDIGQQTYSTTPVIRTVSPAATTTYSVSAVSDGNSLNCSGSVSGSATVVVDPNPVLGITTVQCSDATQIQLTASCTGAVCSGFSWTPSNGGNIVVGSLTSTITLDRPGTYTVTGSVSHPNGPSCTGQAARNVGLCAAGP